ncbi:MAG: DNA translocase FtsK 4TM domain-containing protein [Rhodomicrobium sp.]|nr:DNA translocase FtsK 4TM domain-containing protein [Rhodomicrobium sp.]
MQTEQRRFLPKALAVEVRRLPWRLLGLLLFALAAASWLALLSWSYADPSPNYATVSQPQNWLGHRGASLADTLMEGFGLASVLLLLPLAALGLHIATGYSPLRPRLRLAYWTGAALALPAFLGSFPAPSGWILGSGLGGIVGDAAAGRIAKLSSAMPAFILWSSSALLFLVLGARERAKEGDSCRERFFAGFRECGKPHFG